MRGKSPGACSIGSRFKEAYRAPVLISVVLAGLALGISARARAAQGGSVLPPLPTDPTLSALIDQSLAARPELAQAAALVRAERERIPQAGALPDPMLQAGIQNDSFTSIQIGKMETSWVSIMASQAFPWPGKRRLRSEMAEVGAQQGEASLVRLRLTTEAEVRRAYLDLLLTRDRSALLDRLDAIWGKSAVMARTRYESGQGAQSDVLRSQLEVNRLKQRRWALQAQERARVEGLNRLRGHALDEPIATSVHLVDIGVLPVPDAGAAVDDALARSPELAAARLGVTQAEKSQALAAKSYFGDVVVSAGVMPRGGDFPPMWLVNLGTTIPVYAGSKQNRAVAETEARVSAERSNIQATEQILRLRIEERRSVLAALLATVKLYREGVLVQSEATVESTLAQYSAGKVSFASVLEANAGFISDEEGYLQAIADAQRLAIAFHEVSLEPTAGGGFTQSMSAGAAVPSPAASSASGGM